jgi:hypothetical protein
MSHVKGLEATFRVYALYTLFCIKASPFKSILNSGLIGDTMVVTQEISVVGFGQESKFLFIMQALRPYVTS